MEEIERAIYHAVQAGKLRDYVRRHGESGLGGLPRLSERHTRLSAVELAKVVGTAPYGDSGAVPVHPLAGRRRGRG